MNARPSLRLRSLWPFLLMLLFTGCITIEENYTFKKDGSGTLEYVVDMSELADLMKSMPGAKGGKDDGLQRMDMGDDLNKLKGLPGISKVALKKEQDGFIQRLSFRFADVKSLNGALNTLMPDSTGAAHEFFRWEGNTLVRTNNAHATEMGDSMGGGGGEGDSTDVTSILESMHYKYHFAFADEIAATEIADGVTKASDDPKKVDLSTDWSVIAKDPKALDLRIELKK